MPEIQGLGKSKPRSMKSFWVILEHQFLSTTVDMHIIVNYINYLAWELGLQARDLYNTIYRNGSFNFTDKQEGESYIKCLARTGQLRKLAEQVMDKYPYEWAKKERTKRRKAIKVS